MWIPLNRQQQILVLEVENGMLSVDCKQTQHVVEAEQEALDAQVESLFPRAENGLIEGNHILNVDRSVVAHLIIKFILVDQRPHALASNISVQYTHTHTQRRSALTHPTNIVPHLVTHWLPRHLHIVIMQILPLGLEGIGLLEAFESAAALPAL